MPLDGRSGKVTLQKGVQKAGVGGVRGPHKPHCGDAKLLGGGGAKGESHGSGAVVASLGTASLGLRPSWSHTAVGSGIRCKGMSSQT